MKKILAVILFFLAVLILVPFLIFLIGRPNKKTDEDKINVYVADTESVAQMSVTDYLIGVVSAEMPANFETEALKAQAVAARSYLYVHASKADEAHHGAAVCTDSTHCQAWISREQAAENWGGDSETNYEKIRSAVTSTANEVVTYNGEIADAVFHSTSSGRTENAADVWGAPVEYLMSVDSPGEELSPRYTSEASVSEADFIGRIKEEYSEADRSMALFTNDVRSEAGGIISADVCGVTIPGTKLRSIFGLRSTNFTLTDDGQMIHFSVKGNGHGVGMSQYGANYMASEGNDYKTILMHYYSGTRVEKRK